MSKNFTPKITFFVSQSQKKYFLILLLVFVILPILFLLLDWFEEKFWLTYGLGSTLSILFWKFYLLLPGIISDSLFGYERFIYDTPLGVGIVGVGGFTVTIIFYFICAYVLSFFANFVK